MRRLKLAPSQLRILYSWTLSWSLVHSDDGRRRLKLLTDTADSHTPPAMPTWAIRTAASCSSRGRSFLDGLLACCLAQCSMQGSRLHPTHGGLSKVLVFSRLPIPVFGVANTLLQVVDNGSETHL